MKCFYKLIALNLILCILLCGCGQAEISFAEPAMEISKNGSISQTIVETFDKDYYSTEELREDFIKAIDEFGGDKDVSLIDIHEEDGKVFVSLSYSSPEVAQKFSGCDTFFGAVGEAYDAGYSLDVSLKNVSDGSVIGKTEIMSMSKNHIFISSDSGLVYTPYKIISVSANVEVLDNKKVRISSDSDGLAYIVMK